MELLELSWARQTTMCGKEQAPWMGIQQLQTNSKRSELAGYAASLELLLMLVTIGPLSAPFRISTITWIERSSAGKHLSNLKNATKERRRYPHNADLLSHIQWLWRQLSQVDHNISWVKAHQDNDTPIHQLPRNAYLNIQADSLASAYGAPWECPPPRAQPAVFPACPVSIVVNGQLVTSYVRDAIRYASY